jgi:hypothetical protein
MDFAAVRKRSLIKARQLGYVSSDALPLLDGSVSLRSVKEISSRALIVNCIVAAACGFPAARSLEWIVREGLAQNLTAGERTFLQGRNKESKTFAPQVECLWIFAWAFSKVSDLHFARPCSDDLVLLYPNLRNGESSERWNHSLILRPFNEIVQACDLAYCLHWAVIDAGTRAKGSKIAKNALMIIERRRALEWMLNRDRWDAVILDT